MIFDFFSKFGFLSDQTIYCMEYIWSKFLFAWRSKKNSIQFSVKVFRCDLYEKLYVFIAHFLRIDDKIVSMAICSNLIFNWRWTNIWWNNAGTQIDDAQECHSTKYMRKQWSYFSMKRDASLITQMLSLTSAWAAFFFAVLFLQPAYWFRP